MLITLYKISDARGIDYVENNRIQLIVEKAYKNRLAVKEAANIEVPNYSKDNVNYQAYAKCLPEFF